jgi:hypothetical protein
MPKRLSWSRFARMGIGTRRPHPNVSGLALAIVGGFLASYVIFQIFSPGDVMTPWLALSREGLHNVFVHQLVTHVLVPNSIFLHVTCGILFYLAAREIEPVVGPVHFTVMLAGWAIIGGTIHLLADNASLVRGAAPLAVGALAAFATVYSSARCGVGRFTFSLALLACGAAFMIALFTAETQVIPGVSSYSTASAYLAPFAALSAVTAFSGVYLRFLGLGPETSIESKISRRQQEKFRVELLGPDAFICEFVDPILEKIGRSGQESLTRRERKILEISRQKLLASAPSQAVDSRHNATSAKAFKL